MNTSLLKPIKTEEQFHKAIARFEELFEPELGTDEYNEFYLLGLLIHEYESENHSIEAPSPVDMIRFRMEQMDLRPKDLVGIIGTSGRVSEVLSGRRRLTLPMIAKLRDVLQISADSLIELNARVGSPKKGEHSGTYARKSLSSAKAVSEPKRRNYDAEPE